MFTGPNVNEETQKPKKKVQNRQRKRGQYIYWEQSRDVDSESVFGW